jgi:signal transduction histidine kinase/ligand-binding sensor domain-containing protein
LLAGSDGRLWIGTSKGLASWKDGKLRGYPELAGQYIFTLLEDRQGTVWVSAQAGPTGRLCAIKGSVLCNGGDGSFGLGILSLYEDSHGSLWAAANSGLWRWSPGPPTLYSIPDSEPRGLIEGDNGALWIAMRGGIRRLIHGKVEPYPIPGVTGEYRPNKELRDRNGGLWISTWDRGLLHLHEGRTDIFDQSDGLSSNAVQDLYEDREGSIWAATSNGLDRFRDFAVPTISLKQGLSNASVSTVLAAKDGSVWLGTRDGLDRWNHGRITVYRKLSKGVQVLGLGSLFQDERGRIWNSTVGGVNYFDHDHFTPISGMTRLIAYALYADGPGNLWISDRKRGLLHLFAGKVVEQLPWASLGKKDAATALLPDPVQGGLWMAFYEGGVAYFKDGQVRTSYGVAEGLGEGHVANLQLDGDGTLWAATEGGLSRIKNGRGTTLSSRNGLPCDTVMWVMEDDAHSFWLYMPCGLVHIARPELDAWIADPKRKVEVKVFDSYDGVRTMAGSAGYSPRIAKATDGKLWFISGDGASVIDPRELHFNKPPPPVHVEQIKSDGTIREAVAGMRLPALSRDVEIDYIALSLVVPEKNRFRVKLEGWDRDWKDAGNERKAFYGNLPPRNYRFRVVASNNSGVWNEAGDSFEFSIDPAYYQTRWFQALCAAAFLAVLWGLYRYRLHQVAREFNMRLDERVGERTRLARDLHDTLLQGFQGLMLRLQAIGESLPEGEIKEELERALDRGDQVVTESRKAVHDLRLSTVLTNDLARAVRTVGDELSSEGSATFALTVEGETRELHPIVRDEVYRITREGLRNAFSHARAKNIEVEIIYGEQLFQLRIRDNGEGIAAAVLEKGRPGHYGLPGIRERAAEIGAKLDIWSGAGTGTEIDLSIGGSTAYGKRSGRMQS